MSRVWEACDELAEKGVFPGPTALNELLHGHRSNNLNGRETKERTEWLRINEYAKDDRTGRWSLPVPADVGTNGVSGDLMEVHRRCCGRYRINGYVLRGVHSPASCEGEGCPIHHPSDHHMRDWPLVWRGSGPFDIWAGFERQCPHGIGHLDPDTAAFMRRTGEYVPPHGCDGCCHRFKADELDPPRIPVIQRVRRFLERLVYV